MIDYSILDSMTDKNKQFYLQALSNCKHMINYYNKKDWKVKKGKLGNLDEEFIGSFVEK